MVNGNDIKLEVAQLLPTSKQEFILRYVLCRALGHTGGMCGISAAREAENAWNYAEKYAGK